LGFVKDTTTGMRFLKEFGDYSQLYELEGSGLRAICVSDFEKIVDKNDVQKVNFEKIVDKNGIQKVNFEMYDGRQVQDWHRD
jgi:hypothetical protein